MYIRYLNLLSPLDSQSRRVIKKCHNWLVFINRARTGDLHLYGINKLKSHIHYLHNAEMGVIIKDRFIEMVCYTFAYNDVESQSYLFLGLII